MAKENQQLWIAVLRVSANDEAEARSFAIRTINLDEGYITSVFLNPHKTRAAKDYFAKYAIPAKDEIEARLIASKANPTGYKKWSLVKWLDGNEVSTIMQHAEFDFESDRPRILIIGTRITEKSIHAGYYYLGVEDKNPFWEVLSFAFREPDFRSGDIRKIQAALKRHNIVVADFIYSCEYAGSKDVGTVPGTEILNPDMNRLVREADIILLNGTINKQTNTGVMDYFRRQYKRYLNPIKASDKVGDCGEVLFEEGRGVYYCLRSTADQAEETETKKQEWKQGITEALTFFRK